MNATNRKVSTFNAGDARNPLSSHYHCKIQYGELTYPSLEHAFQAQRVEDQAERVRIRMAKSPGDARRVGESLKPRIGWDKMKLSIMSELLAIKFSDRELASKLIATGDDEIVYTNEWNDRFWGSIGGNGENWLGRLTMAARDEARVRATNEHITIAEDGKIPAATQREIEEAAKSNEEGQRAQYLISFAMHVLILQSKFDTLVAIRNGCKGSGSAVERRMIERRIAGLGHAISKSGRIWVALMTGRLKPWLTEEEQAKMAADEKAERKTAKKTIEAAGVVA